MSEEMESEDKEMEDYEIDDCVRTLIRAEEIKSDSKKMAKIRQALEKKKKAINSIQDMRDKRQKMSEEDD